jgi:hypothetical protein
VGWNTGYKGYTSSFYDNPKGWTSPRGTGKTLISTIQNNRRSFSRLQSKLQLFQTHLSPACKNKQCNPFRLVVESPWSMTSIFHKYGLGVNVSGTDTFGAFELHLAPKPSQRTPSLTSIPTLPPRLYSNRTQVTIVEVKDLRQTVAIEIGYRDTNAWMEWIKYSVYTLDKSNCYVCTTGRPVSGGPVFIRMVLGPRWNVLHVGSVSGCQAWGNESCQTLSLLFPKVSPQGLLSHPPQTSPCLTR